MKKKEFAEIRRHLGKTQSQEAQVLGGSPKAIQNFEHGWRNMLKSGKHVTVTGCLCCPADHRTYWLPATIHRLEL